MTPAWSTLTVYLYRDAAPFGWYYEVERDGGTMLEDSDAPGARVSAAHYGPADCAELVGALERAYRSPVIVRMPHPRPTLELRLRPVLELGLLEVDPPRCRASRRWCRVRVAETPDWAADWTALFHRDTAAAPWRRIWGK